LVQSREYLERHTDILFGQMPDPYEREVVETVSEGDQTIFVAATGKFGEGWEILPINHDATTNFGYLSVRSHLLTDSLEPDFASRNSVLAVAARSTCRVTRLLPNGNWRNGTAFFISPTILLTAGHVAPQKDEIIMAQKPGKLRAERDSQILWQSADSGEVNFKCRVVATLFAQQRSDVDVSVLKTVKGYRATSWVPVDMRKQSLQESQVDLLGYPGEYSLGYLSDLYHLQLNRGLRDQLEAILPPLELIVSHGVIIEDNDQMVYRLSTAGGMSGGPVIFGGKAIGMRHNR